MLFVRVTVKLSTFEQPPAPTHPLRLPLTIHRTDINFILPCASASRMSFRFLAMRCLRQSNRVSRLTPTSLATQTPSFLSSTLRSFASSSHASYTSDASHSLSPAVMFLVRSEGLDPASIKGTGKDGRLVKFDVIQAIKAGTAKKLSPSASSSASSTPPQPTLKKQEGPRFTATGRRNRSAMFEPLPRPAPAPPAAAAAGKSTTAAQPTKLQSIDKAALSASSQPKAATKPQQVVSPVLRRQDGPRFTAGGRRNRSAMFHSP